MPNSILFMAFFVMAKSYRLLPKLMVFRLEETMTAEYAAKLPSTRTYPQVITLPTAQLKLK